MVYILFEALPVHAERSSGACDSHAHTLLAQEQRAPIRFTFWWPEQECWEGRDYTVALEA